MAKAADDDVVGGGSFRCVYQWRRKLWSSPLMMEGAAHESNDGGGNYALNIDLWTHSLAAEEVSTAKAVAVHEVGFVGRG